MISDGTTPSMITGTKRSSCDSLLEAIHSNIDNLELELRPVIQDIPTEGNDTVSGRSSIVKSLEDILSRLVSLSGKIDL